MKPKDPPITESSLIRILTPLFDGVNDLSNDMVEVKKDLQEVKKDVAVLKKDVSILKKDVSILKTDVKIMKEDIAGLLVHSERTDRRFEDHDERITSLEKTTIS